MLLRTSVVLFSSCRASRGSVLCHVARKDLPLPKLNLVHTKSAHRSARSSLQSSSRFSNSNVSKLKIPFLFTVGIGSGCYFGSHYLGKLISPRSHRPDSIFAWWHSKPDSFKVYWLICGTCILVFSAVRLSFLLEKQYPAFGAFMTKFFTNKRDTGSAVESCAQLVLSAFTHISPLHLAVNMFVFHNISKSIVPDIGKEKFLGAYLFSAVMSGFTSFAVQVFRASSAGSVGASGAILGIMGIVIHRHPEYSYYILFLPHLKVSGYGLLAGILTLDTVGLIRGWQYFDHAGHLGGVLSGLLWSVSTSLQKVNPSQPSSLKSLFSSGGSSEESEDW